MTTNQEKYQPLIEFLENNEVYFVKEIQNILDYIVISTLSEKNNANILPLCNSTHFLIELRNAIEKCRTE